MIRLILVVSGLVSFWGCESETSVHVREIPEDGSCTVAVLEDLRLERSEVDLLSTSLSNSPTSLDSDEHVVDVVTAHWIETGELRIDDATAVEESYRAVTARAHFNTSFDDATRNLAVIFGEAREELDFRKGDCFRAHSSELSKTID